MKRYNESILHEENKNSIRGGGPLSPFSTWQFFSYEQAKSECDWMVMSSVFVTSQPSCFFLCSREQIRLVENRLKAYLLREVSVVMV